MGWKLSKQYRDSMLASSTAIIDRSPCDVAVGDGTALMYLASSGKFLQTAVQVAGRLLKLVSAKSRAHYIVVCFDGPAIQMPPSRGKLYATRYKQKTERQLAVDKDKGMIICAGRSYKPGTEPYNESELAEFDTQSKVSWSRLLASRKGKAVATSLLIRGLTIDAQANPRSSNFRLIISGGPDEVCLFYPRMAHAFDAIVADQIKTVQWGEADNRVTEAVKIIAARHTQKSIRVYTIDTDMVLQLMCVNFDTCPASLSLDLVKSNLIDVTKLRRSVGSTCEERLSAVALLLCAKGCDYSNGLTMFGYRQQPLVNAAFLNHTPFVRRTEEGGLAIDTDVFSRVLKHVPRWSIKDTTPGEVRDEIVGLLTTLGLFSLVGPQNSPPGPREVALGDYTLGASSDPFAAICLEGFAGRGEPIVLE